MELHHREAPGDDPQGSAPLKKPRIHKESEKVKHTTHWDMDYLPQKEVDALYGRTGGTQAPEMQKKTWLKKENPARFFSRLPLWLVLLIVILLFGRFLIILFFHFFSPSP